MTLWIPRTLRRNSKETELTGGQAVRLGAFLRSPAGVTLVFLLCSPLLALIHQGLFLFFAILLRAATASQLLTHALAAIGFDPIYASVFDQAIGNVDVRGLAIAGPLGDAFHVLAPGLFASSDQVAPGAWVSAVVSDGVSLLASALATVGAELLFIAAGLALLALSVRAFRQGRRSRAQALAVVGFLLQIKAIVGLLGIRLTFDDIEAMGLSQVFTKVIHLDAQTYHSAVVEPARAAGVLLIPGALVLAIYGAIGGLGLIAARRAGKRDTGGERWRDAVLDIARDPLQRRDWRSMVRKNWAVPALLFTVVLSQQLFPAQVKYDRLVEDPPQVETVEQPSAVPTPPPVVPEQLVPSKVEVSGTNYRYTYVVDGRPERIRGVGYNPLYGQLSREERAARYDLDFAQMRAAGVNTILGWGAQQFDELTLTKAQEYGLGVIMPYRLVPDGRYADPQYRATVEEDVLHWVDRFRAYPALRMWGIGNEVVHNMGKNPETPQAQAFAEFYVRLADKVHALDPDHPVTYRAAEDVYLWPMKRALLSDNRARPWFVYGVNFFTYRVCDALRDWPKKGVDIPIMVSEFAPSGLGREDRPGGYKRMWRCIADYPDSVLGGFAYVWSTSGPEALDRSFGLVNPDNTPTDNSLLALGEVFGQGQDAR